VANSQRGPTRSHLKFPICHQANKPKESRRWFQFGERGFDPSSTSNPLVRRSAIA